MSNTEEKTNTLWQKFLFSLKSFFLGIGDFFVRIRKSPVAFVSVIIVLIWFFLALFGPFIAPYDPTEYHIKDRFEGPSFEYPFGTDRYGRDTFSRVIVGSRTVFLLAASAIIISVTAGSIIGLVTGFFGGTVDELIMRFMDILMSFPALLLAMLMLGIFGPSFWGVVIVIAIVFSPRIARVARSSVLDIKTKEYIEAARVRGESNVYIMAVEIFPNTLGPLGVEAAVRFGYAIFMSASLGFLGLGVQPPTPDWGLMMSEAQQYITTAPWMAIFPAIAIASLTVSVNFISDAIRKLEAGDI